MVSLRGNKLENYKENLPGFDDEQKDLIIGTLLGDASLSRPSAAGCYLKITQSSKRSGYVNCIYEVFLRYCGSSPKAAVMRGGVSSARASVSFKTYSLRSFLFYHNQFYVVDFEGKRKKKLPSLLHRWLNPRVLAYWFMDDGSKDRTGGYVLHTEAFSLPEQRKLVRLFAEIFDLNCFIHVDRRVNKRFYRLYIPKKYVGDFNRLVGPYIHSDFLYKIH